MTRRFGYFIEQGPGVLRENDTATCGHCQKVMFLPPPKQGQIIVRVGSPCSLCRRFVCEECRTRDVCDPWEKQMERMEAAGQARALTGGGR